MSVSREKTTEVRIWRTRTVSVPGSSMTYKRTTTLRREHEHGRALVRRIQALDIRVSASSRRPLGVLMARPGASDVAKPDAAKSTSAKSTTAKSITAKSTTAKSESNKSTAAKSASSKSPPSKPPTVSPKNAPPPTAPQPPTKTPPTPKPKPKVTFMTSKTKT